LGDQIKKNEMSRAGMGKGEVHTEFPWRNLAEEAHLKDRAMDGRIILY
jgi:hypothetical protein